MASTSSGMGMYVTGMNPNRIGMARPDETQPGAAYDPVLKQLYAKLNAPEQPAYSDEEVAQRQAMNEHAYRLGLIGAASGLPRFQALGETVLKQAMADRTPRVTDSGTYEPLSGQFTPNRAAQDAKTMAQIQGLESAKAKAIETAQLQKEKDYDAYVRGNDTKVLALALGQGFRQAASDRADEAMDMRRQQQQQQQQQYVDNKVAQLSTRMQPLAELHSDIDEVSNMVANAGGKNVSGLGMWGNYAPNMLQGSEALANRAKVRDVSNAVLRLKAGLNVTLSEEQRNALVHMATGNFTEKDFLAGWPHIVDAYNATQRAVTAGYTPDVVNQFAAQGGNPNPAQKVSDIMGANARQHAASVAKTDTANAAAANAGNVAMPIPSTQVFPTGRNRRGSDASGIGTLTNDEAAEMERLRKALGR